MNTKMGEPSRKSMGAVHFNLPDHSPSSTASPSRRRRSIAPPTTEINFEENDDEAERLARRERNETGSPVSGALPGSGGDRRQSVFGLSSISNVSATEMNNQIAQCIKLNAENKINDKNAFQLKMIDFLVYALRKQDPNMTNLQVASVSLDASAKIYGFRVDKVHSDLLKIIGGMSKQDKRDHQDDNGNPEDQVEGQPIEAQQKKKKKKKRQNIIATIETLEGNVEKYDHLSLIKDQRDTQTSDMLYQAALPQHANQGVKTVNIYNDVILDRVIPSSKDALKVMTLRVDDLISEFGPSYAVFKFLGWSPDDEPEEPTSQPEENEGEFHFDLDAVVPDDNNGINDSDMDFGDHFEERIDRQAPANQVENIVDFHDIIVNNPNPNATYEYSYIQKNYRIHWAGPSHWKIIMNKNLQGSRVVETCKQHGTKKKKEIELTYIEESKEEGNAKFAQTNRQTKISTKTTKLIWSEDKVTFPQDVHHDFKRYYIFFNKPTEHLKFSNHERVEETNPNNNDDDEDNFDFNDNHDVSNYGAPDTEEHFVDHNNEVDGMTQNQLSTQDTVITQTQGAFVGDNLVSAPKLTDKVFIAYSQRAKKIDMRQLKKAMWKNLRKSAKETEKENFDITQAVETEIIKEIEPKLFSDVYLEVPRMLSKVNADSLSPAIAFVSLLHLANEKNLILDRKSDFSDVIIKSGKNGV